jgi:CRISPR-associated protein Csm1
MQERDSFYLGALLHDIGKFVQRANIQEWQGLADCYVKSGEASRNHAHRRYSAAFIKKLLSKFLSDSDFEMYALLHHQGREKGKADHQGINKNGIPLNLIHIADICASKERKQVPELEPQHYTRAKLQSIFSDITLTDKDGSKRESAQKKYLDLNPLSLARQSLFPAKGTEPAFDNQVYRPLVQEFEELFKKINAREDQFEALLSILHKFLIAVPAQTPNKFNHKLPDTPDICLFDHLRVTAAIALCLYDEWKEEDGSWKGKDAIIRRYAPGGAKQDLLPPPCILISGDISGIQDFIFNVPSKGAAKTLKARSFYVQMLADVCVKKVLDELHLKPANLLYNGGGQFYILAPRCSRTALDRCREKIMDALIGEELYLSLAYVDVRTGDFMQHFGKKWAEVNIELQKEKLRKFHLLGTDKVFGTFDQVPRTNDEKDRFFDITSRLNQNAYSITRSVSDTVVPEKKKWKTVLKNLGYDFSFYENSSLENIVFNSTDFEGSYKGFRFSVKDLPRWTEESIKQFKLELEECGRSIDDYLDDGENGGKRQLKDGDIITYSQLAFKAFYETGTEKLGILKMDVDNLGAIFLEGFDQAIRTPSRMMSLSRSLQWFFEGYMNTLLQTDDYKDYIYVIFSGGDDLFIVGAWHKVFDMAMLIQKEFREFVCENKSVTLSASLLVVDEHFPVSRFAVLAEERLYEAKHGSLNKNTINVFSQNLTWDEFCKAKRIKEQIVRMIDDGESKAVIQKILNGCEGLDVLYERAVRFTKAKQVNNLRELKWFEEQKPTGEKVWRLAYHFRDLKKESKGLARGLVDEYEDVIYKAMAGVPVNPMYIAVGARWAELVLRKEKERERKTDSLSLEHT